MKLEMYNSVNYIYLIVDGAKDAFRRYYVFMIFELEMFSYATDKWK